MTTQKVFQTGSYDPYTLGHQYVSEQAVEMFNLSAVNPLTLGIGINANKARLVARELSADFIHFTLDEKLKDKVVVLVTSTSDIVPAHPSESIILVRGIRGYGEEDIPHEAGAYFTKAFGSAKKAGNKRAPNVFFITDPNVRAGRSSSAVRQELTSIKPSLDNLKHLVSPHAAEALFEARQATPDLSNWDTITWFAGKDPTRPTPEAVLQFNAALTKLIK